MQTLRGMQTLRVMARAPSNGRNNNNDERSLARRYCFRAQVLVVSKTEPEITRGIFTSFDNSIGIARVLEDACAAFVDEWTNEPLACKEAEVVFHAKCPVELDDTISYTQL